MKLSTSTNIDEDKYEILGLVRGISIRSFSFYRQFMGGFRSLFGGRAPEFEEKLIEAWKEGVIDLEKHAQEMKADAVYALEIEVSELSMGSRDGMVVISVFGTALRNKQKGGKKKPTQKKPTQKKPTQKKPT